MSLLRDESIFLCSPKALDRQMSATKGHSFISTHNFFAEKTQKSSFSKECPTSVVILSDDDDLELIAGEGSASCSSGENFEGQDPTAQAEIVCIRNACKELGVEDLQGCELYSSCQPTSLGIECCVWAKISEINFAASK